MTLAHFPFHIISIKDIFKKSSYLEWNGMWKFIPKNSDQKNGSGDLYGSTGLLPIRGSTPDFSNNFKIWTKIYKNLFSKIGLKRMNLVTSTEVPVICRSVDPP
jgi:hypothetical protein